MSAPPVDLPREGNEHPLPPPPTAGRFRLQFPGWRPRPLTPPTVAAGLSSLPAPRRCAEVLRFSLLRAEHWLSPGGTLREWLRLQLWLALWLAIPAALVVPVFTAWLSAFTGWSTLLAEIVRHLLFIPAGAFAGAFLFVLTVLLLRALSPRR